MQSTSLSFWFKTVSMAMAVLPVCRSPRISSRCPRPIGMRASITFNPVCSGMVTGKRSMMAGASCSQGRRCCARTGPWPSRGRPTGSTTRPSNSSPTGRSKTRPVRLTSSPACSSWPSSSRMTPISSSSRLKASPNRWPGNFSNSSDCASGKPLTRAIPRPT